MKDTKSKSFSISKKLVFEAWLKVKANGGSYGVDRESIQKFDEKLKDNLYKIWNRMSSGSYFPPPVRQVVIPKSGGGERSLGIPTVADRVAQMVVKMTLEPKIDPMFHSDSYGYRPGKSAIDAVRVTRKRCWSYKWVVDLDIKGFFDNIDHDLMMRAVNKHTDCSWIKMYISRWLKTPLVKEDGSLENRDKGTPQGGVVSPLLANLFLHYAFDLWMARMFPNILFERYADDIVIHSRTFEEARRLKEAVERRLLDCKLQIHPEKTKIVFCKDSSSIGVKYPYICFDFLGFTFRPRKAVNNRSGQIYTGFLPAISNRAKKRINAKIRSWKLKRWLSYNIEFLAKSLNPIINGWINYYGAFYRSRLHPLANYLDLMLMRWIRKKFKKRRGWRKTMRFLSRLKSQRPLLFAHWHLIPSTR